MVKLVAPVKKFLQAYDAEHHAKPVLNVVGPLQEYHMLSLLQTVEEKGHQKADEIRAAFMAREAEERAAFAAKEAAAHKMVDADMANFQLKVQKEATDLAKDPAMVKQ